MKGIVDRIGEGRVVLEVGSRYMIFKESLFPSSIKEGDLVVFKAGRFSIDQEATRERSEEIENLFDSLIDRSDE